MGKVGYEYILTSWHEINAYTFATETLQFALGYDKVPLVIGMTGNNCIVQIMNTTTTSVTVRVYNYNSTTKNCQGVVVVIPSA